MVRDWERLQVWITKEQDSLALQDLLTPAAKAWKKENKDLWDTNSRLDRLKEIQNKDTSDDNWLNAVESEFITKSISRKRNRRVVLTLASLSFMSFLTILTLSSRYSARKAQLEQRAANIKVKFSISNQLEHLLESIELAGDNQKWNKRWLKKSNHLLPEVQSALYLAVKKSRERGAFTSHQNYVTSVSFSSNGKYIISGSSDGTVKLWSMSQQTLIYTFNGHQDSVTSVHISPNSKYIVSGSYDNTVKLWSVEQRKLIHTFNGHRSLVNAVNFSSDNRYIVSGSHDNTIKLWSVEQRKLTHTFDGHQDSVMSVDFSPDGKYFVSASIDKTVKLWSVEQQSLIHTFDDHRDFVVSVAFSPNGKYIVSSSWDQDMKLWWGMAWQDWIKLACNKIRLHPALVERETSPASKAANICLEYAN